MTRFAKIWSPVSMVLLLGIILCSLSGKAHQHSAFTRSIIPSFAAANQLLVEKQTASTDHFVLSSQHWHSETYRASFERKKKTRFIVRHQQQHQALRKSLSKAFSFSLPPSADPDHEPVPDDNWQTRPKYYIFLFRLSPF